jgi:hypothetical protein
VKILHKCIRCRKIIFTAWYLVLWKVNFIITALVLGEDKHVEYVMELHSHWTGLTWKRKQNRLLKHTTPLKNWTVDKRTKKGSVRMTFSRWCVWDYETGRSWVEWLTIDGTAIQEGWKRVRWRYIIADFAVTGSFTPWIRFVIRRFIIWISVHSMGHWVKCKLHSIRVPELIFSPISNFTRIYQRTDLYRLSVK